MHLIKLTLNFNKFKSMNSFYPQEQVQLRIPFLLLLILILNIFCINQSNAQNKCTKKVGYFSSRNAEKLANQLTKDLDDDKDKVEAIHCWITHHIKYDISKGQKYDFSRVPVKTILKKRKAICTGYTDLFNELCKHAGIVSTEIPGYTKGILTDINDKFYMDEHIWNAVYINNEWHYIDNTWDAGYVINHKRTIWGYLINFLSGQKNDGIKIKPKFKFRPVQDYFYKDANTFYYDHFPANPIWQLGEPLQSLSDFEKDSSFFLKTNKQQNKLIYSDKLNEERNLFISKTEAEKLFENGKSIYAFNQRNPFTLAVGEAMLAKDLFDKLNNSNNSENSKDNNKEIIYTHLKSAKIHFDSSIYQVELQKEELKVNNKKKHELLISNNNLLISSTKKVEKNLESGQKSISKTQNDLKTYKDSNFKRFIKFYISQKVNNTGVSSQYLVSDSLEAEFKRIQYTDSLQILNNQIKNHFIFLDSLYEQYNHHFAFLSFVNSQNAEGTQYVNRHRLALEDDLDFSVRSAKDSIIKYRKQSDSILYHVDKNFIIKSYLKEIAKTKDLLNRLDKNHKALENEYTKLVKIGVNHALLEDEDLKNKENYNSETLLYLSHISMVYNDLNTFKQYCKKLKNPAVKERKLYELEKKIEAKCYEARSKNINQHATALTKNCKNGIQFCSKLKEKVKKE